MTFRHSTLIAICAATLAAALVPAAAIAAPAAQPATVASQSPQPGDCKTAYETGVSQSTPAAQAVWTASVAAKFGNNWANWVGARNRQIVPLGNGTMMVRAQPCFYYPVQ